MKKKNALFMAVMCLVIWGGGISAFAAGQAKCDTCDAVLVMSKEHLDHWTELNIFTNKEGKSITCYETHSIDRTVLYCPKGHGIYMTSEPQETISHSVAQCPDNKH